MDLHAQVTVLEHVYTGNGLSCTNSVAFQETLCSPIRFARLLRKDCEKQPRDTLPPDALLNNSVLIPV